MKKLSGIILVFSIIIGMSACSKTKTYSQLQDEEKATIQNFVNKQGINVVYDMPGVKNWVGNTYFKSSSGLYYQLVNPGSINTDDTMKLRSKVSYRFMLYTLTGDTIQRNLSTIDYTDPFVVTYGDYSSGFPGLHEALKNMKYNNSKARLIIPHSLNTSTYMQNVTPVGYDIVITGIH